MTTKFTHDHDPEIAALYRSGTPTAGIADKFGVTQPTIVRALKRQGVALRSAGRQPGWADTEQNRREMIAAYQGGESIRHLAKRYGCRTQLLIGILNEAGVDRWNVGARARFDDQAIQGFATAYLAGETLEQIAQRHDTTHITIRRYLKDAGIPIRPVGAPAFWTEQRKAEALRLHQTGSTIKDIAKALGCGISTVSRSLNELGIPSPYSDRNMRRGPANAAWRGGRIIDGAGYVRVRVTDADQHIADGTRTGYMMEHRLVMARLLGRRLLKSETVHHIDNDKQHNDPGNLQLRQGKHGKGAVFRCASCGSHDIEAVPLV